MSEDVVLDSGGVAGFLSATPPLDALSAQERAQLAGEAVITRLADGEAAVDDAARATGDVWVVMAGQLLVWAPEDAPSDEPTDVVNTGGLLGVAALLLGEPIQVTARANGVCTVLRVPGRLVMPVFSRPEGVRYLAGQVSTVPGAVPAPFEGILGRRAVGDLMHVGPVVVSGDISVREAARRMTESRSSYVVVPLAGGEYGIFTDGDLRSRVVAADVSVDAPVRTVMSAPVRVVSEDRVVTTVLVEMLEHGVRHMPVVDGRGRLLGVIDDIEMMAASTRRTFELRRTIARSPSAAALVEASAGVRPLVVDLVHAGTDAVTTSGILSVVIDCLARRALELALAESPGVHRPRFAWISLGSVARREALPSSDIDSAMSWADDDSVAADHLRLAKRVHEILDACALPADTNGALASSRRFARSGSQWLSASQRWMREPLVDEGLIMSSLLVDGRVVWGDPALHTVPLGIRRMRLDHPEALRLQLLDALSTKVWQRSLRTLLSPRRETVDLKGQLLTPIVNLARWGGLSVGVGAASTPARLAAAMDNDLMTAPDSRTLEEVFLQLQRVRMQVQVDQIDAGRTPTDVIALSDFSSIDRRLLTDCVREVAAVQKRISTRLHNGVFATGAAT
ncbi:putative nucleotidyltransferase substrate binding domain-containing protein [Nostocoides japonicum]|nr:putative nucleotidyltransferase substrate binding domain-containing protein [Tetrasphaera japonica]